MKAILVNDKKLEKLTKILNEYTDKNNNIINTLELRQMTGLSKMALKELIKKYKQNGN